MAAISWRHRLAAPGWDGVFFTTTAILPAGLLFKYDARVFRYVFLQMSAMPCSHEAWCVQMHRLTMQSVNPNGHDRIYTSGLILIQGRQTLTPGPQRAVKQSVINAGAELAGTLAQVREHLAVAHRWRKEQRAA